MKECACRPKDSLLCSSCLEHVQRKFGDSITFSSPPEIQRIKQQNADLLAALEEMINPPTIMDHDHPFEIASWFVEKAKQAIADAEGGE